MSNVAAFDSAAFQNNAFQMANSRVSGASSSFSRAVDCCCSGTGTNAPFCCTVGTGSGEVAETLYLTISGCNNPDQGDMDGTYELVWDPVNEWWYGDGTSTTLPAPCFGTVTFLCRDGVYEIQITEGTPETGNGPSPAEAISCDPFLWTGTNLHIPSGPPYDGNACCVGDTLTWTITE